MKNLLAMVLLFAVAAPVYGQEKKASEATVTLQKKSLSANATVKIVAKQRLKMSVDFLLNGKSVQKMTQETSEDSEFELSMLDNQESKVQVLVRSHKMVQKTDAGTRTHISSLLKKPMTITKAKSGTTVVDSANKAVSKSEKNEVLSINSLALSRKYSAAFPVRPLKIGESFTSTDKKMIALIFGDQNSKEVRKAEITLTLTKISERNGRKVAVFDQAIKLTAEPSQGIKLTFTVKGTLNLDIETSLVETLKLEGSVVFVGDPHKDGENVVELKGSGKILVEATTTIGKKVEDKKTAATPKDKC